MAEVVVEYFMVDGKTVVPAEFHFLECRVPTEDGLVETTKWMTPNRWKELMMTTSEIVSSCFLSDRGPTSEPVFITTENLRLAYVLRLNSLQKQVLMNLKTRSAGDGVSSEGGPALASGLSQHSVMLVVAVSILVDNPSSTQDEAFRNSLGCSMPSSGNKQPKINSYFSAVD